MPDEKQENDAPHLIQGDLFDAHKELLADLWNIWGLHRRLNADLRKMDAVRYSRLSVVTFSQIAAVTALDASMTEEQFLATCKANFDEAVKRAPRWA
jgi:hypothetical protein